MNNKKAQGMPMNVVIIAIIVLVVLVIIIAFFVGGFSNITKKLSQLFTGQTSGQSKDIVLKTCESLCEQASTLSADSQKSSGYCTQLFSVDHDGKADTPPQESKCSDIPVPCSNVPC